MKLIKARIRGLDALTESRWFDLDPKLNMFHFPEPRHGKNFLRILQTINPPFAIETVKPFADLTKYQVHNGYTRHVNPAKRTVSLTVFAATPGLVRDLSTVNDVFYETDRIEVGRRLDYSRWINFVELASSTRWSEIADDMAILLEAAQGGAPGIVEPISECLAGLRPSDRIKGKIKEQLAHWLNELPPELQQKSAQIIEAIRAGVDRVDHFAAAREIVCNRIPLFVVVGCSYTSAKAHSSRAIASLDQDSASFGHLLQLIAERASTLGQESASKERSFLKRLNEQLSSLQPQSMRMRLEKTAGGKLTLKNDKLAPVASDGPLFSLRQMQAKACLAVALSRIVYKTEAILLFDEPERGFPETLHKDLVDFIINISKSCQCLYTYSRFDIFPKDLDGRQYLAEDLDMATG